MTNEEKAREIAHLHKITYIAGLKNERGTSFIECMSSAYQMAEWKDQQFKEYIETHKQPVLASETDDTIVGYSIDFDEIINELFKEE